MKYLVGCILIIALVPNIALAQSENQIIDTEKFRFFTYYNANCIKNIVLFKFKEGLSEFGTEMSFHQELKKVTNIVEIKNLFTNTVDSLKFLSYKQKAELLSILTDPKNYLSSFSVGENIFVFGNKDCTIGEYCAVFSDENDRIIFYIIYSKSCRNIVYVNYEKQIKRTMVYINDFGNERIVDLFKFESID